MAADHIPPPDEQAKLQPPGDAGWRLERMIARLPNTPMTWHWRRHEAPPGDMGDECEGCSRRFAAGVPGALEAGFASEPAPGPARYWLCAQCHAILARRASA
jgi:hypothetical protein